MKRIISLLLCLSLMTPLSLNANFEWADPDSIIYHNCGNPQTVPGNIICSLMEAAVSWEKFREVVSYPIRNFDTVLDFVNRPIFMIPAAIIVGKVGYAKWKG